MVGLKIMKITKKLSASFLAISILAAPFIGLAADEKPKAKPYPLKTCVVSGDKLGEMGDPYVFEQNGREIKLCCKNCLKDFNKNSAKYIKKLEQAENKAKSK